MGCQPGSLSPDGLGDKAVSVPCSCRLHLQNGIEIFSLGSHPNSSLLAPHSEREREGEERQRKKHSPSDLRPSQRVSWPLLLPQGRCTTVCHFLLSVPSFCSPFITSSQIPPATHHFPTDSMCPIFPPVYFPSILSPETTFLPFPSCETLCLYPLARPTLILYPDSNFPLLDHFCFRPPLHRSALMLSPQNINSLGQPSSFYPWSPHPCTARCFIFPDLISYPSFLPSLFTLPSKAFVPSQQSSPPLASPHLLCLPSACPQSWLYSRCHFCRVLPGGGCLYSYTPKVSGLAGGLGSPHQSPTQFLIPPLSCKNPCYFEGHATLMY